jgi:hypothetical protein
VDPHLAGPHPRIPWNTRTEDQLDLGGAPILDADHPASVR